MKIALDAMGGDFAPKVAVEGALLALTELSKDTSVILVGKENEIRDWLIGQEYPEERLIIQNAEEVVGMHEHPAKSFSQKPDSSISVGFKLLKTKEANAFCSAGNTGAMMVHSLFVLKTHGSIQRPPIAGFFPLRNGKFNIMLDIGANADCKPELLQQFAELGSIYASLTLDIQKPRVALLNIGEEETKGSQVVQATYQLLKNDPRVNFVGNIEGRDLFEDKADVVVTEGFTGNVIFKMGESLYEYANDQGIDDRLINRMNYEVVGGSPIIGVKGNVIVGHGISSALAIKNMILLAEKQVDSGVNAKIAEVFGE
ncbi:phosphate acyltransferase PlsX [Jiulongibacter sediminis]|uniref:Phosphate acyltransferase n=1 Tax=Jiulongibacter sediminis TaxID=1605367 RepID=A0A0P7C4W0_9BACT|nr:phosphate acyltransferase PlsX [Jiulongibacter sediminis]KPM47005.1 phosphate acyltransferase [Jiulongibacter sediminis]TBX22347.1 phosphate acyltransferase [Jiulongibacter sediminis]